MPDAECRYRLSEPGEEGFRLSGEDDVGDPAAEPGDDGSLRESELAGGERAGLAEAEDRRQKVRRADGDGYQRTRRRSRLFIQLL